MKIDLEKIIKDNSNHFLNFRFNLHPAFLQTSPQKFKNITPKVHDEVLLLALMRCPFPKIIVRTTKEAYTYEVINNHKFLETILYVVQNQDLFEPRHLARRIMETEIPLLICEGMTNEECQDYVLKLNK